MNWRQLPQGAQRSLVRFDVIAIALNFLCPLETALTKAVRSAQIEPE